ncbi:MAG TPA: glucose 1-dehydrogenase [Methylomirabilota bacterium]|nr:glucose 1-dehydrogenase [Methylomirabilota bacterium]
MGRLDGKTALITGAGSGIGDATARLFAREGAAVAAADRDGDAAGAVARAIAAGGGRGLALTGDVARREDAERWVTETVGTLGRLDILINSAGVTSRAAPPDWDWERTWDWVMAVNLKGSVLASRVAAEAMVRTGGGSIVNLSSIYGLVGRPLGLNPTGIDAYSHSKGAVVQLTRDMALHFARQGVRVNALCPGFVVTSLTRALTEDPERRRYLEERHPMGRLARPEEIAPAALFLASDEASFITGVCLPVDGGYTAQ